MAGRGMQVEETPPTPFDFGAPDGICGSLQALHDLLRPELESIGFVADSSIYESGPHSALGVAPARYFVLHAARHTGFGRVERLGVVGMQRRAVESNHGLVAGQG